MLVDLPSAERLVAERVLTDPEGALQATLQQLASSLRVSQATIIRFSRRIGYAVFPEFKLALSRDLASPPVELQGDVQPRDSLETIVQKITGASSQALRDVPGSLDRDTLERAVQLMSTARKVMAFGIGSSGLAAQHAGLQFTRIGRPCEATTEPSIAAVLAAASDPGDVALLFSTSGLNRHVVTAGQIARERSAAVIAVTSFHRSPLARTATHLLLTPVREERLYRGTTPAVVSQLCVVDLLHAAVSARRHDEAIRFLETSGAASAQMNDLVGAKRYPDAVRTGSGNSPNFS